MSDETVKFSVLCSMFEAMLRNKASSKKRKQFRTFLDRVYTSHDYFSAVRLVLPWLDRERGSYGLKEHVLATCIIDALGMSRESEDALRFINWRRGGAKMGANAGNFALVASEILQRRQGTASGGLTIKELNDLLDRLASADNRVEKTSVLSDLIKKTNALEMKWIVMIILKDLKLGVSEKNIFYEFHPDAQDLFNVTCDLKLVCEKLKNRTQRYKRQDIEVGKPVRPQLALRVADATTAWKKLHGKQVVVECKFDGDRMQIHKNGSEIFYFSRNFLEHPEYGHAMSKIIQRCVQVDKCILDGEMLVWDTSTLRFADFGSNQEIAKAEQEGLESDQQLCYVAFDILYVGDTSVIHQSLRERHELLRKVIKPLKGRLEILVPNGGLNPSCPSGEPCWSLTAYNVEDVERFFKETIENRDEGIVLKDLDSKWEPADRSAKWLKLKPDYIHPGSDLDVIIIGGYFGTGRHGGEVAQFLLGLAERSTANSYPKRFISFCRVGTGLSDAEHDALVTKLKPYFRKNENPKKAPHFYGVTNKERPDVWIESPEKSIIVSINCDIRTIKSSVFASPYGLRFPRVIQVRYDKPWYECLDVQSFVDLVQSHNGNTQRGTDHGDSQIHKPKRAKSSIRGGKKIVSVPSHLIQTDVSDTKKGSLIFTNMMFYFVNAPPNFSIDSFRKMVVENGGNFSMNLNDSVTHCIAAERKGIKYQAAVHHSDIIHYSWILDCCSEKRLLHLQPKYFLHFTNSSRSKLQDEVDAFSDYYYWDIDVTDVKQIFYNMNGSCLADPKSIEHYKKKICPMEKWSLFQDCHIYFYHSAQPLKLDCKVILEISLRRMKLEVSTRGGQVSNSLSNATHLVVFSFTESGLDIATELNSFPAAQKHLLNSKKLHVLRHQWLEDSLVNGKKLSEDAYSLNPNGLDELSKQSESCSNIPATSDNNKNQILSASTDWKAIQQKSTPSRTTNAKRGRAGSKQVRRTRARIGNRPAKISRDESENSDSSEESSETEKPGLRRDEFEGAQQKDGNSSRRKQVHNTSKAKRGRAGVKQARSTRALIGSRPTKISRDEYKSIDSSDEVIGMEEVGSRRDGSKNAHGSKKEETKGTQAVETDKISRFEGFVQTEIEEEKLKDTQGGETDKGKEEFESSREGEDGIPGIEEKISSAQNHECESTIDPLQAMLLDMIPGLDVKNNKTKNASFSDEKSQFDTGSSPVKKKRVSYKDIASQFFKDE